MMTIRQLINKLEEEALEVGDDTTVCLSFKGWKHIYDLDSVETGYAEVVLSSNIYPSYEDIASMVHELGKR